MAYKVFVFCDNDRIFTVNSLMYPKLEIINVEIGKTAEKKFIHDSMAATPGRYIESLLYQQHTSDFSHALIINPFIDPNLIPWGQIHTHLETIRKVDTDIGYICDQQDKPLGVLINNFAHLSSKLERIWFRFLSMLDSTTDISLLRKTQLCSVQLIQLDLQVNYLDYWANGFYLYRYQNIYKLMTLHALNYVQKSGKINPKATAIMPYHAGDLLFFLKALKQDTSLFQKILVCRDYADIVKREMPQIDLKVCEVDSLGRGSNKNSESTPHQNLEFEYFYQVLHKYIDADELFYFFRPYRLYSRSHHHLIDQFHFAISNKPNIPVREKKTENFRQRKINKTILFHFDGGWDLKIYPFQQQLELIRGVEKVGLRAVVLSDKSANYPCDSEKFSSIERLEKLILNSDILVGMDSFPCHFSTHTLQHPTICLFSSTRPSNSDNTESNQYVQISNRMSCCPCDASAICPKYNSDTCKNFSSPADALHEIKKMHNLLYGVTDEKSHFHNL